MPKPASILLVEDDPRDVELLRCALAETGAAREITVARDGAEALDYLHRRGAYERREEGNPSVLLLDLKLPKIDGLEVLRRIKTEPALSTIPVVILVSSQEERRLVEGYGLGASACVVKPAGFYGFVEAIWGLSCLRTVVGRRAGGTWDRPVMYGATLRDGS